jgi:hypothetical protein
VRTVRTVRGAPSLPAARTDQALDSALRNLCALAACHVEHHGPVAVSIVDMIGLHVRQRVGELLREDRQVLRHLPGVVDGDLDPAHSTLRTLPRSALSALDALCRAEVVLDAHLGSVTSRWKVESTSIMWACHSPSCSAIAAGSLRIGSGFTARPSALAEAWFPSISSRSAETSALS